MVDMVSRNGGTGNGGQLVATTEPDLRSISFQAALMVLLQREARAHFSPESGIALQARSGERGLSLRVIQPLATSSLLGGARLLFERLVRSRRPEICELLISGPGISEAGAPFHLDFPGNGRSLRGASLEPRQLELGLSAAFAGISLGRDCKSFNHRPLDIGSLITPMTVGANATPEELLANALAVALASLRNPNSAEQPLALVVSRRPVPPNLETPKIVLSVCKCATDRLNCFHPMIDIAIDRVDGSNFCISAINSQRRSWRSSPLSFEDLVVSARCFFLAAAAAKCGIATPSAMPDHRREEMNLGWTTVE